MALALAACACDSEPSSNRDGAAGSGNHAGAATGGSPAEGGAAGDDDPTGGTAGSSNGGAGSAGVGGRGTSGGTGGNAGDSGASGAGMGGSGGRMCPAIPPEECNETLCPTELPEEATTCAPDGNTCGCDDLSCPADTASRTLCVQISALPPVGAGGPNKVQNVCAMNVCAGDDDCPGEQRCLRNEHGIPTCSPACRFDSECTRDCGGRCEPLIIPMHATSYYTDYSSAQCVYDGPCGAESCANCANAPRFPAMAYGTSTDQAHFCN